MACATVKPDKPKVPVYYGEIKCEAKYGNGKDCRNNAYFYYDDRYLCGVHSKKYEGQRIQLPKNPNNGQKKQEEQDERDRLVEEKRNVNQKAGIPGDVTLRKLKMMTGVPHVDGYQSVLPNFKHGNRKDALGLSGLSPKSLGPVKHVMPNLPPAVNIEDYHQQAKFWSFELDSNGSPTPEAHEARIMAYQSGAAERHKHSKDVLKKYSNVPEYSVYYDSYGNERRYSYLECRYFYCHYYELLAGVHPQFKQLKRLRDNGTNLNLIGYDSYLPTDDPLAMYRDTRKPFGHEMVLYCMLIIDNPEDYPWNQFRSIHEDLYQDMF